MHRTSIRHSVTDSQFSYRRSSHRSRSPIGGRHTTVVDHSPIRTYGVGIGHSPIRNYGVGIDHSYSPVRSYGTSHHITHSPLRAVTTTRNLGGTLTNNVIHHSPSRHVGRSSHLINKIGDSLVSYGINDDGDQVRVTSTGIVNSPQLRTVAERISPPRTHITNHVTSGHIGYPVTHSTTITGTSPVRQVKETVYNPGRIAHPTGYVGRGYSPLRGSIARVGHSPLRSSYSRVDHSPLRRSYSRVDHSPLRSSYSRVEHHITHSPARSITRLDHSPVRSVTRIDHSPVRRSIGVLEPVTTVVNHAPVTQITAGPVRTSVSRMDYSPMRRSLSRSISPRHVHHDYDLGTVVPNAYGRSGIHGTTVRHYESPSRNVSYSRTVLESNTSAIHRSRHVY